MSEIVKKPINVTVLLQKKCVNKTDQFLQAILQELVLLREATKQQETEEKEPTKEITVTAPERRPAAKRKQSLKQIKAKEPKEEVN